MNMLNKLHKFHIGTSSWGENYLECTECCWLVPEEHWETLADLVALAEVHTCSVTVECELAPKAITG